MELKICIKNKLKKRIWQSKTQAKKCEWFISCKVQLNFAIYKICPMENNILCRRQYFCADRLQLSSAQKIRDEQIVELHIYCCLLRIGKNCARPATVLVYLIIDSKWSDQTLSVRTDFSDIPACQRCKQTTAREEDSPRQSSLHVNGFLLRTAGWLACLPWGMSSVWWQT